MAEALEKESTGHDGDPWAEAHMDPRPWCEVCEGPHDDHAAWLTGQAALVAAWSESAEALEIELARPRAALYRTLGAVDEADDASRLYGEIRLLIGQLRQVADAAAWRAHQEAGVAQQVAECGYCTTRITLLNGRWTADDGTTACTDTSAPYVPHKPKEASDGE